MRAILFETAARSNSFSASAHPGGIAPPSVVMDNSDPGGENVRGSQPPTTHRDFCPV